MGLARVVRGVAAGGGAAVVFVLAAAGGALAHRNLPAARRALVARVNAALASAVPGTIVIDRVGVVGMDHLDGADLTIFDPQGTQVLQLHDVTGRIDTLELLRSLGSGGPLALDLPDVTVRSADVNLDAAPGGPPRIVRTFVPDRPATPTPAGRGVSLEVRRIRLEHLTVHGTPTEVLTLDAEVDRLDAYVHVTPGRVHLDLDRADVTARGLPPGVTTRGSVQAHLEQPSPRGGEGSARVSWQGTVGAVPTTARAMIDGNAVYAVVDSPAIEPDDLRALWPASPLDAPAAARVEAVGLLPDVVVSARATSDRGAIEAEGPVSLAGASDSRRASIRFAATSFDARAVSSRSPATSLDTEGHVLLTATPAGAIGGVAALDLAGTVGPTVVPLTAVTASFSRDPPPSNATRASAHLVVREAGAPTTVDATVTPKGDGFEVAFDGDVLVPDLDRVVRLGPIAHGSARLSAHGHLDTDSRAGGNQLDANISCRASGVAAGPVSAASLALEAHAGGPLTTPVLDGDLTGNDLEVAGLRVARLHAGVHGPASAAEVSVHLGGPDARLEAKATVSAVAGAASVRDLHVIAERGSEKARLDATHIRVTGEEQRLDDAELHGFGAPLHVSARATPGTVSIQAHSHDIDLGRVARFAGLAATPAATPTGRVALDLDTTLRRTEGDGHLVVDVTGAKLASLKDSEAHLDLTLAGRRLSGTVTAREGQLATVELQSSSLDIGGRDALGLQSWRALGGTIDAQAHVDLAQLASALPDLPLPVSKLAGVLDVQAHATRDPGKSEWPDLTATATTTGLVATGPASAPWTLKGIDLRADLAVDPRTDRTTLEAQASDARGVLTAATVAADKLPYARLLAHPGPLLTLVRPIPFAATVQFPGRDVADLPAIFGTRGLRGQLAGSLAWGGTLDQPRVDAQVTLTHGATPMNVLSIPLDLALTGHYDGEQLTADLTASQRSGQLLDASTQVSARIGDVLASLAGGPPPPWKGSAHVQLSRFPLQSLAALDDRQVRGHLSGDLSIQGLHDDAQATFTLDSSDLAVGELPCKSATAKASFDGKTLDVQTRVDQTDGFLQASAHTGARWGAALTPSVDPTQPADVALSAKTFRVALIQPFVESVFSELDGRIDANLTLHADRSKHLLQPQGSIRLTDGVVEVASVGGEFHGATAEIDLTPDGVVRLQNASAMGLSGKLQAAASARFDGVTFAGARASLLVARQQPLPLVLDGVQVGTFDGQLGVAVDPIAVAQGGGLDVKVDVSQMQLQLPDTASRTVQALGTIDGVTIGMKPPGAAFVPVSLDGPVQTGKSDGRATPLRVTVALGSNVVVKRGTTLQVYLGGSPTITVTDDVRATGQVKLLRGSLDVQGKTFTIENGTVTFVDDPTNPQVVLTASWPAPDGTTIYADFIGPLKTGKVTLRADPARPQNEILSLILFGTTDETAQSGGTTAQQSSAVGAAGGAATAPINQALGGVNQMLDNFGLAGGISTRVDTSQATPRPEVEIQIARDLSIQVAWVLGVPPPGSNPDSTLFTLDWRFLRSWSLETTVGDAGTSILDLIWTHRY